MTSNLNLIFPSDYLNRPTEEDLMFEVQDLLRHNDYPPAIIDAIKQIHCPYYREALLTLFKNEWMAMTDRQDPRTGYKDSDGNWIVYWRDALPDMNRLIRQFQKEQYDYIYETIKIDTIPTNPSADSIINQISSAVQNKISYINKTIVNGISKEHLTTQPIAVTIHNNFDLHFHIAGDMVENKGIYNKNL